MVAQHTACHAVEVTGGHPQGVKCDRQLPSSREIFDPVRKTIRVWRETQGRGGGRMLRAYSGRVVANAWPGDDRMTQAVGNAIRGPEYMTYRMGDAQPCTG